MLFIIQNGGGIRPFPLSCDFNKLCFIGGIQNSFCFLIPMACVNAKILLSLDLFFIRISVYKWWKESDRVSIEANQTSSGLVSSSNRKNELRSTMKTRDLIGWNLKRSNTGRPYWYRYWRYHFQKYTLFYKETIYSVKNQFFSFLSHRGRSYLLRKVTWVCG